MTKRTICFDLDGTLSDPKPGITRSIQYALEKLGRPVPEADALTWCIGPPLRDSFTTLLGDAKDAERAVAFYRERFGDIGYRENALYPGISEAISTVTATGARLLVTTSKPTVYARRIIEHFDLSRHFEDVCGSELDGTRADKSDLLAWVVAQKAVSHETCIMVGDRKHDIIGAYNNGITSVAVLYGYGSQSELHEAGASHFCAQPSDLPELLAKL